jgi:hypothetical protein
MNKFLNKNRLIIIFTLLSGIFFIHVVYAGTLSCTIRTSSCSGGEVEIFEMQNTTNSHAGLPAASYTNLVCCGGVSGLGNDCASSTKAVVLKLSGATNAHARQNQLADYAGANNACISVPSGGSVSVGYQPTDCAGFDTTLASMKATTNSHVGNTAAYAEYKICATAAGAGTLSVDIVDAGGSSVASPSITMGATALYFTYQTVNGAFGVSTQKIRVDNITGNSQWSLSLAATNGPTAFWDGTPADYDFNDPTANAGDGGDADNLGGQMTVNPSGATITPQGGCNMTGLTLGSSASYSQGVTDSITLLSAGSSAGTNCYWDTTGIAVSQTIPAEQPAASDYDINMTLTITAI